MRATLQFALCLLLAGGTALAQRGGGHGGGGGGGFHGGGGGFHGGGMGGGGFRGGFGGGGFRGGFGGGGFGHEGYRGFNRGFGYRGYGGYYGGYYPYAYGYPYIGSYAYWPFFDYDYSYPYGYDYGYPAYSYNYPSYSYPSYSYPSYNPSPNVTVIYPQQAQEAAVSPYTQPAHPVIREYDQYGQEIAPQAPSSGVPASPVYLFAFKDNVIRAASSYWVEGQTLHYVTLQHEARQVPLSDLDRSLTLKLNSERHVTIQLPQ